jgi:hypothetical protein
MRQDLILAPMGGLAALTFLVLMLIPFRRFQAAFTGRVTARDFVYGESPNVPSTVSMPNRNYMNLLEIPVLFYIVCLMYFVTGRVAITPLILAWLYVGLRALHSGVHLTYNNVPHRLAVFALSNVVLAALWIGFFVGG